MQGHAAVERRQRQRWIVVAVVLLVASGACFSSWGRESVKGGVQDFTSSDFTHHEDRPTADAAPLRSPPLAPTSESTAPVQYEERILPKAEKPPSLAFHFDALSANYTLGNDRTLKDPDPKCLDPVRSSLFGCLDVILPDCAIRAGCPAKRLSVVQDAQMEPLNGAAGLLQEILSHVASTVAAPRHTNHRDPAADPPLSQRAPAEGSLLSTQTVAFCTYRNTVVDLIRVLDRIGWYCRSHLILDAAVVRRPQVLEKLMSSCRNFTTSFPTDATADVTADVTDEAFFASLPNSSIDIVSGATRDTTVALEDVMETRRLVRDLLSTDWHTTDVKGDAAVNLQRAVRIALRVADGSQMATLLRTLGLVALQAHSLRYESAVVSQGSDSEVAHRKVNTTFANGDNRGCPTATSPVLRVAVIGDDVGRIVADRLRRWLHTMCDYCRSSHVVIQIEDYTYRSASLVVDEELAEKFTSSLSFKKSVAFAPHIVIVSLGRRDATTVSNTSVTRASISEEMTRIMSAFAPHRQQGGEESDAGRKPYLVILTPPPVFDTVTAAGPSRRASRVTALIAGRSATRLGEVVVPGIRDAVETWPAGRGSGGDGSATVTVVDLNLHIVRWMERLFLARMKEEGELFILADPPRPREAYLYGLHFYSKAANYALMKHLPDGATPRKSLQKMIALLVLNVLMRPQSNQK